jgi:hypothetical protein
LSPESPESPSPVFVLSVSVSPVSKAVSPPSSSAFVSVSGVVPSSVAAAGVEQSPVSVSSLSSVSPSSGGGGSGLNRSGSST